MTLEAASSIAADKGRRLPGGVKGWRQGPQSPEGEKLKVQFEKIIFFSVINFNVIFLNLSFQFIYYQQDAGVKLRNTQES